MTYRILFAITILFGIQPVFAQILVGPALGGQVTWMKFDDNKSKELYRTEPVFGFHAGASIAFRVQKRFFLHGSVLYAQRGKLLTGKVDDLTLRNDVTYRYIDVPLLYTAEFKARIGRDKVYKWYFGAGPNISYWLGGKGVLRNGDLDENLINPPDYNLPYTIKFGRAPGTVNEGEMGVEDPNRVQLGLNISTGLVFEPMDRQRIMVTARYMLGHSFFSRTSEGNFGYDGLLFYFDDLRVRNQEFVLTLHYFIDLKTEERNKGKSTLKIKKGNIKRRKR
jgi:hypothetical protein